MIEISKKRILDLLATSFGASISSLTTCNDDRGHGKSFAFELTEIDYHFLDDGRKLVQRISWTTYGPRIHGLLVHHSLTSSSTSTGTAGGANCQQNQQDATRPEGSHSLRAANRGLVYGFKIYHFSHHQKGKSVHNKNRTLRSLHQNHCGCYFGRLSDYLWQRLFDASLISGLMSHKSCGTRSCEMRWPSGWSPSPFPPSSISRRGRDIGVIDAECNMFTVICCQLVASGHLTVFLPFCTGEINWGGYVFRVDYTGPMMVTVGPYI